MADVDKLASNNNDFSNVNINEIGELITSTQFNTCGIELFCQHQLALVEVIKKLIDKAVTVNNRDY
ncbi:unnamed protein product [Fusarium graminearum]|uniref:Uncharacterized protein n=1 Tax=Gibberella zeae TaxID=5518 RepID=A0A4V6YWX1_GIBZA|nr:unnamed protein product [Fusarium graminearum]CAF3628645.1 unnamed protein product [Fusarium graminearum]CAG1973700.1 unnamed protein product [Fusarium graminearum]CAG1979837.1 unnamed protein product [Fusarium graminearum]CAG2012484.1 unnamed protein product [Fusarium graminearum]